MLPLVSLTLASFGAAFLGIHGALIPQVGGGAWLLGAIGLCVGCIVGLVLAMWASAARTWLSESLPGTSPAGATIKPDAVSTGLPAEALSTSRAAPVAASSPEVDEFREVLRTVSEGMLPEMFLKLESLQSGIAGLDAEFKEQAEVLRVYGIESERLLQQRLRSAQSRVNDAIGRLQQQVTAPEQWMLATMAESNQWSGLGETLSLRTDLEGLRDAVRRGDEFTAVRQHATLQNRLRAARVALTTLRESVANRERHPAGAAEELDRLEASIEGLDVHFLVASLRDELERLRAKLIELLDREYRIQMGDRANPQAIEAVREGLRNLGLRLVEVQPNETPVDYRFHEVISSVPSATVPPGRITQLAGMGYADAATEAIVRAPVIISAEPSRWT